MTHSTNSDLAAAVLGYMDALDSDAHTVADARRDAVDGSLLATTQEMPALDMAILAALGQGDAQ